MKIYLAGERQHPCVFPCWVCHFLIYLEHGYLHVLVFNIASYALIYWIISCYRIFLELLTLQLNARNIRHLKLHQSQTLWLLSFKYGKWPALIYKALFSIGICHAKHTYDRPPRALHVRVKMSAAWLVKCLYGIPDIVFTISVLR